MKLDAKQIIQKWERLYGLQANWRSLWQEVADYIVPKRSNILTQNSPGTKQTTKLFDSTAIHANELLAASMKQAITPSNIQWFSLRVRDDKMMENKVVSEWLEDCSRKMFLCFHQSNFDSEVHEIDQDLGSFGMGAMYAEELIPWQGLRFHTVALGDYCVEENFDGRVDTMVRQIRVTARAAFQRWGKNAGEKIVKSLDKNPEQYFKFLHHVAPISRFLYQGVYVGMDGKNFPEKPKLYREFPYLVPRWSKTAGEEYGRGPGFTAMPDIKTLNKAIYLELQALAKMINPPIKVDHNGVIGIAKLQPGGITTVTRGSTFEAIKLNIDLNTVQIKADELRQSIRRIFFSDQLQLQDTPQMTAAEAYIRYELMQRILGPTLGRMEREFLNPLIQRVFWIMSRAGVFLPMPPELEGYKHLVDIQYEGAMAKAQRSQEITALMDVLQIMSIMAQSAPEVLDWLNLDKIIQWLVDMRGVPKKLLNDINDVAKTRKARASQGVETKSKQDSLAIAEVIRKLTAALKAGVISPEAVTAMTGMPAGQNNQIGNLGSQPMGGQQNAQEQTTGQPGF